MNGQLFGTLMRRRRVHPVLIVLVVVPVVVVVAVVVKLAGGGGAPVSAATHAIDMRATVDVDSGPEAGLQKNLNPGGKQRIVAVYDVPTGTVPQAIELHGAPKSHGVTVALPAA